MSLEAHTVKNLPARPKTRVQSLGQKDPLEKEMANPSHTLAWKIPWATVHGTEQLARSLFHMDISIGNLNMKSVCEFGLWFGEKVELGA